jgi:hypothetical protein
VAIALPLYTLITNLKFVEKVFIDAERKAAARGEGDLQRRSIRFSRSFVGLNTWTMVFIIDFIILIIASSGHEMLLHVFAMVVGIGVILLIHAYRKMNNINL